MAATRRQSQDGVMFILEILVIGCIAFILRREAANPGPRPEGMRGFLRSRGWALLLIPVAMMAAVMAHGAHPLIPVEFAVAVAGIVFAPRLAAQAVPYAVLALGFFGLHLAQIYRAGFDNKELYGLVLAGGGSWATHLVLPEALAFIAVGVWLLLRLNAPGAGPVRALLAWWLAHGRNGIRPRQGLLLLPVVAMAMLLLGPGGWLGSQAITGLVVAMVDTLACIAALALVFRSRVWAATIAVPGLLVLGAYGWLIVAFWPSVPGFDYGVADLTGPRTGPMSVIALEATVLIGAGLWLAPRVIHEHLTPGSAPELAARAQQLTQRVQTLTQTRSDAVDTAAAELRRIERDLHDGAQARLVALGMSLQAAERLFPTSPEAAMALITEAKENSSRALTELRDLVRGIYPPVLADRGLGDAIRALALDTPLPVTLDIDLSGPVELPVASAVYFSVAEALANASKHAHARSVRIALRRTGGMLRAEVTDDGAGGADAALGTGLTGVERRLATFDGILAISSPPGGPTIVAIEVPCASSSAKTSTS